MLEKWLYWLNDHADLFNQILFDLLSIDILIKDEDQTLMFLCQLSNSYKNFVDDIVHKIEYHPTRDYNIVELEKVEEEGDRGFWISGIIASFSW